jgi:uncharacterized protein YegP (UPF0339 family)
MHVEQYKDEDDKWRWRTVAANGNIVADSGEGYENKQDCLDMVDELFPHLEVKVEQS